MKYSVKTLSTAEQAEELNKIIQNFAQNNPEALEEVSTSLGVDVGLWGVWTSGGITQEDLDLANELVTQLQEKHSKTPRELTDISTSRSTVSLLKECHDDFDGSENQLPNYIYEELAKLTSSYSLHHKTKTVHFRNKKLEVTPDEAYQDGGKDTFKDNGPVAQNYYNLISSIIKHAEEFDPESPIFSILSKLYCFLTTLSSEACNQQNALEFAGLLQTFSPESASSNTAAASEEADTITSSWTPSSFWHNWNPSASGSTITAEDQSEFPMEFLNPSIEDVLIQSHDGTLLFLASMALVTNLFEIF